MQYSYLSVHPGMDCGNIKKFQCLNEQISYIHVFNEGFLSTVLKSAFLNEYIQQQFVFVLF